MHLAGGHQQEKGLVPNAGDQVALLLVLNPVLAVYGASLVGTCEGKVLC